MERAPASETKKALILEGLTPDKGSDNGTNEAKMGKTMSSPQTPLRIALTPSTATGSSPGGSFEDDRDASQVENGLRQPDFLCASMDEDRIAATTTEPLAAASDVAGSERVYWEGFFVNMPMFCGYAALFGLQHEIKSKFNISDGDIEASRQFGVAVSFLYIFNLIFRFSHNILFGWVGPRGRAYIAMMSMMASMLIIAVAIFVLESYSMWWVMLAYALGGVAMGTFEANFLCCLTPLGPRTKHVAITAIPLGITAVLVGAFAAMGPPMHVPAMSIYCTVAAFVAFGMVLFAFRVPKMKSDATGKDTQGLKRFVSELSDWRLWLPLIWTLPVATAIDMFTLSAFSPGVALYIYDTKTVAFAPGWSVPNHDFFAIYNTFNMMGGLVGRILSYRLKPRHPLVYTVFNIVGASMILLKIPLLAPFSTFLVMMGDGLIYGTIARHIDATVPKQFNLVALSFWLFVGDFGSVLGSNLISYIRVWVVGH